MPSPGILEFHPQRRDTMMAVRPRTNTDADA
jgi:hypothetical protein